VEADSAKIKLKTKEKVNLVVQEPDTALVNAAIKGDTESFTELCRRYYPAMVAIAHSITGDKDLAEDAAQMAFAKAAVNLPQIRNVKKFPGWLTAICRNIARDLIRRENSRQRTDELSNIATKTNRDDSIEIVREALNRLSASGREIIYLRFYDGLSYGQISSLLGISEQAINGRLRRAKRKMAEYIKRHGINGF
jgi:RNA polymerase sigma-70 factor (ECF subfamily)